MKGSDGFPIDPFAVCEISKMDGKGLNFCIVSTTINKIYLTVRSNKKPLTIITKHSILDFAAVLDPPPYLFFTNFWLLAPIIHFWPWD